MSQGQPPRPRDIELIEMPSIASQMPVEFENGNRWADFEGCCARCGQDIPSEFMRGSVIRQTPHSFTIEAVGVCVCCRAGTPFLVRMHDDASVTTLSNGVWGRLERKRPSRFSWLGGLLRWLFNSGRR
jgi:hypothetical protein